MDPQRETYKQSTLISSVIHYPAEHLSEVYRTLIVLGKPLIDQITLWRCPIPGHALRRKLAR